MSNVKTITRAQAIENAIQACKFANNETATWDADLNWNDVVTVLEKMHEQLTKPRKAAVSKARVANEGLAKKLAKMLPAEGLGSKGIVGLGLPEVATTQKAAAVMRVAEELGLVQKVVDKKVITYKPVAQAE